jgi:C1A family cysteine protease
MHKFGYIPDALDFRDFNYGAVVDTTRKLPKAVDLTNLMPPVYHQGNSSSCVAQSVAAAMYYNFVKNKVVPENLSRLFIYYNTRAMENSIDLDQGCQIRNAIKSVANIGAPNEKLWPFIPIRYKDKPVQKAYDQAKTNLVSSYSRVNQNLYELKYCLASGYPVVFGIAVYTSFTFSTVEKTGIVYLPKKGEKLLGGHALCCLPGTSILTEDGYKNIEDVTTEDKVLTHKGQYKKVLNVMSRDISENVIRLKNRTGLDLVVTKEHPIFTKKYSYQTKLTQTEHTGFLDKNINCVEADKLEKGNLIYIPINKDELIYSNIKYEKEFFELLGMYIGDGNIALRYSKNGNIKSAKLRFSLGKNYPDLIEKCTNLLKKYSKNGIGIDNFKNNINLVCYDTKLALEIGNICGFAKKKKIPKELLNAPLYLQKEFIKGWYETDGCDTKNGICISSVEKSLIEGMQLILRRLSLIYNTTKSPNKEYTIRGRSGISKGCYSVFLTNFCINTFTQKRSNHKSIYTDNYLIFKNKDKIEEFYSGMVFNIEVEEDNSYTANNIAVHNCLTGYNDDTKRFSFRNSYGTSWGNKGYGTISYDYVTSQNLADDFWVIKNVL